MNTTSLHLSSMVLEEACHAKHLIEETNDWTNILDKEDVQIDVILIDFGKAFDVVLHHYLLIKLTCMV